MRSRTKSLTAVRGVLKGGDYALDGFGIYGPQGEGGRVMTNADLDECHGHEHSVAGDTGKIATRYHYHATAEFPYLVGCYKGTVVSRPPPRSDPRRR